MPGYISNITFLVSNAIQSDWFVWVKDFLYTHNINHPFYTRYQIVQLLDMEESESTTYAIQLFFDDLDIYYAQTQPFIASFINDSAMKYGDKAVSFQTLMELVG